MSTIIVCVVTAAVAGPAGYYLHVWWPRHQGRHSDKDSIHTVDVLIAENEERIAADAEAQLAMENTTVISVPNPAVEDSDTRLIASNENQPTLLSGDYGGREPEPLWPKQSIA